MNYINAKKIIALISAGFILVSISGCQKKPETNKTSKLEKESHQQLQTDPYNDIEKAETKSKLEDEIIIYFEKLEEEIKYYINEENFEKVKEKAKDIAITGIDFIFYGREIKGVTFNELTDNAKGKIMYLVSSIDSKIETKIPGYKETIKDKFGQGYNYISGKLQEGLNYIDGKLAENYGEDYQNTKDKANKIKDDVKDGVSSAYEKVNDEVGEGFTKLKKWYEDKTGK